MKFLCEQCKAKYQIADEKAAGKTVRMKCRKCGHLIEVRAAVTETSAASVPPPPVAPRAAGRPKKPSLPGADVAATKPPALRPRATPFAAGGAAARTAPKPDRPTGALEDAFKSAVQHDHESTSTALPRRGSQAEEEASAPIDMSDLSPSDEWYVAINGVPVGPIRVAEVRRKAALGAVTEDSLVWQEGLDEWRPLRTFPELAVSVREAMTRLSRPPPAEKRTSSLPPPPPRGSGRTALPGGTVPRLSPPPPRALPSLSRSNVVPFMSRLATAEKLDEPLPEATSLPPGPQIADERHVVSASVVPDPFGRLPMPAAPPSFASMARFSSAPAPAKKSTPWMALAMIVLAGAFGITAAVVLFMRPTAPPPPTAAGLPVPGASATAIPIPPALAATPVAIDLPEPGPNQPYPTTRGPAVAVSKPSPTAMTAGRALDLHSLAQSAPTVTPTDEPGSDLPKTPGQCFSEGQVQQVIGLHQVGIRRACWERNPTSKPTVNVGVSMTIGPEGSAQNVVATGDEPSISKCIENDVRGWRFPAMGCAQKTSFSFKFVRQ